MFRDRFDAGRQLAERLGHHRGRDVVILALPRGGVPVAYEVARALGAPLDLLLVRKIGAPFQPELAAGAVVDGIEPVTVINEAVVQAHGIDRGYIDREASRQLAEIARRRRRYFGDRQPLSIAGRTVIVVDDGIATGTTVRAALQALRRQNPSRLVLAVPVAPPESIKTLTADADEIVVLLEPDWLGAVGQFYRDFHQLDDEDVIDLLESTETKEKKR